MINRISTYLAGQIYFKAQGGLCEKLLNLCIAACIPLKFITSQADGFTAYVSRRYFKKIKPLAHKTRTELRILRSDGIYNQLVPYKRRFGIMLGIVVAVGILLLSPHLIWSIRFYDFTGTEIEDMRRLLYDNGVYEGTFVHKNVLANAKKNIVIASDNYGWVGLNFSAGRLVVEKTDIAKREVAAATSGENIIAAYDGIIRRVDLSGGFLQVGEGQSVAKGDLLVSSTRNTATGAVISTEVSAKIFAELEKSYEYTQKLSYSFISPTSEKKSRYILRFCELEIPLFLEDSKGDSNQEQSQERLLRYPLNVCGFALPCTVYEYEVRETKDTHITLSEQEALAIAKSRVNDAIAKDLADVTVLDFTEESFLRENSLIYRIKIRAEANIAKNVQASR